jgi:hypothetical protein
MKDTLHVPTLSRWLYDLSQLKNPTNFQLMEAWQIAQTLHGIVHPIEQRSLDDARRDVVRSLARSDNEWSKPRENLHQHMIVPSSHRLEHWTEIDLTPELSWSMTFAGRTVPSALVKKLRVALGRQHTNLKRLMAKRHDT